ncbi:MAG: ATP-dependent Clp protease protease subunit [Cycloclasticus pugetii]|jgi:ATP-dependent Clp protease protease subunit
MNPLLKLLAQNKGKGQPIKAVKEGNEATIYVYGAIVTEDYWGDSVVAESFVRELRSVTEDTVHIRVQSPGGDVFAGVAMAQAILEHPSKTVVHIDGMAASAATFLVMAADETVISAGAEFMIHKAWTIAAGNEHDFIKVANDLARIDSTIVDKYMTKVGEERAQVVAWMDDETSWFGQEAVDAGFVDNVSQASVKNVIKWDLSAYKEDLTPKNNAPKTEELEPAAKIEAGPKQEPANKEELELDKQDLSAQYRQLEVVTLTA